MKKVSYPITKKIVFVFQIIFLLIANQANAQIIISEYTTKYAWRIKDAVNRAHNVQLAASKLNNTVIQPGQIFSFNETVGPRTANQGFKEAHVIISGKMVDGIGGGVCQVASTLHAAALYAGLTMLEEHPHSRTSVYIDPTLDTTVAWGSLDFKFINNFTFPIKIETEISLPAKGFKKALTIRIVGQSDPNDVKIDFQVIRKRMYKTKWFLDPNMKPGTKKKREPGTYGYDIVRIRTVDGKLSEETKYHYEPSDRIWDVGPKL